MDDYNHRPQDEKDKKNKITEEQDRKDDKDTVLPPLPPNLVEVMTITILTQIRHQFVPLNADAPLPRFPQQTYQPLLLH